jgi:hypothetical protein
VMKLKKTKKLLYSSLNLFSTLWHIRYKAILRGRLPNPVHLRYL